MNERKQFLEAISANQFDELIRLVFADWLDEHGECELAIKVRKLGPVNGVVYPVYDGPMEGQKVAYTGSPHFTFVAPRDVLPRLLDDGERLISVHRRLGQTVHYYELQTRLFRHDDDVIRGYCWTFQRTDVW